MNTVIRKAGMNDVELLCEMISGLFSVENDFEINPQKQRTALEMIISGMTGGVILLAEADSGSAGMVNLQKVVSTAAGGFSVLLEDLYVVPGFRRMGIGKLLLDHAVQWGRDQNALRVQLAADMRNSPAAAFYAGGGFEKSNMVFYYKHIR